MRSKFLVKSVVVPSLLCLLVSCTNVSEQAPNAQAGVPSVRDGAPLNDIDVSSLPDAVPRLDPVTRAGNKNPYTINGKTYHLLPTSNGYKEVGMASWYGTKFHGNRTANGEIYSMYEMTAAHKTLPIPSYAQVRNLANDRRVIVRVNDRGPFHGGRIIDLSYAAAKKLGYSAQGTARVEVTVIDPVAYQKNSVQAPSIPLIVPPSAAAKVSTPPEPAQAGKTNSAQQGFLQVGAFSSYDFAAQHRQQASTLTNHPVYIEKAAHPVENTTLFKVMVGPVSGSSSLLRLREDFRQSGLTQAFVVYTSGSAAL